MRRADSRQHHRTRSAALGPPLLAAAAHPLEGATMCQGDDPNCVEFEQHRAALMGDLGRERRAFLKSSFVATGAAAAMAGGGISLVPPALAQATAQRQFGPPGSSHAAGQRRDGALGLLQQAPEAAGRDNSGDYVTIET